VMLVEKRKWMMETERKNQIETIVWRCSCEIDGQAKDGEEGNESAKMMTIRETSRLPRKQNLTPSCYCLTIELQISLF